MKRYLSPILVGVLISAVMVLVLPTRLKLAEASDRSGDYALFDPIVDIHYLINAHFFKELDDEALQKMQEGAIRGMLDSLDDPYTEYIPARDIAEFDKEIRGEYAGIGAQVGTKDGWIQIISPMEDSPAYRSGIEADDLIVAVEGQSTFELGVDSVIELLTGEPNTPITLTIERAADELTKPLSALPPSVPGALDKAPGPPAGSFRFDLRFNREKIVASTVKGVHRVGDKWSYFIDPVRMIGYVRVTQFTAGTVAEFEAACRGLVEQGMKGLILDLRFNGGGSLFAAVQMADLFLKEGKIVSTKGRMTRNEVAFAQEKDTLPDFPMLIVLNQQSASASEVVAGALADNGRAIILGERSFGKGIVQTLYRLPSGSGQLKVTEQYYYLPSGRCLQRTDDSPEWGVDPTSGFYMPMTNDEYREMLRVRRAEEVIRRQQETPEQEKAWADPQYILDYLKDKQLSAAVTAIRGKLETGEWTPTGLEASHGSVQLAELSREERRFELLMRELARTERRIATLESATGEKADDPADLIPGEPDLTGGSLEVKDKDGNTITVLTITGADLEAWLSGAPIKPQSAPTVE